MTSADRTHGPNMQGCPSQAAPNIWRADGSGRSAGRRRPGTGKRVERIRFSGGSSHEISPRTECLRRIGPQDQSPGLILRSDGAAWVTRTPDPIITNDVLYRLS